MAGMSDLHQMNEERQYIETLQRDSQLATSYYFALQEIKDISAGAPIGSTLYNIHMFAHKTLQEVVS